MGVEAARLALRSAGSAARSTRLWFATADPAYLDKTNATAIHAALRLDGDAAGARPRRRGALRRRRAADRARGRGHHPRGQRRHPHRPADQPRRVGRRRRAPPRCSSGDGAAGHRRVPRARRRDRRVPRPLAHPGRPALQGVGGAVRRDEVRAARRAGVERGAEGRPASRPGEVDRVVVTGHARPGGDVARQAARRRATAPSPTTSLATVGNPGTAQAGLLLASRARAGRSPARSSRWSSLADGADVLVFRTTDAIAAYRPARPVADADRLPAPTCPYGKFLAWRGMVTVEPPRRPEPARVSGVRGRPLRGLEVRLRRVARPLDRRAAPPAGARVDARRCARRHGAGADGRHRGHDRHVHDRQARVLAQPADRVRGRRLRRRRALPGGADRRRRRPTCRSATGWR